MVIEIFAFGLQELVTKVVGDHVGESVGEHVGGFVGELATTMAYEVFGQKNPDTPNGQFLMLMDDSLCDLCDFLNRTNREYRINFEYDSNAYRRIRLTTLNCLTNENLLKSILREMLGEESYELLEEQDIKQWIHIVDYRLVQDRYQALYRYILSHTNKQDQLSTESVLKIVQALNTIKGEETIEDVLCDWFSEHCSDFSDSIDHNILEIGYILTDYLEKRKNYEKSVEIANQLLKVYNSGNYMDMPDKEYIRKIIGCAYSLAIANVTPEDKKKRLLNEASFFLDEAKKMCQNYENIRENQYEDIEFLWGLYYSDYGALLVNKGNLLKNKGDFSKSKKFYEEAETAHKISLKKRKNLRSALETNKLYDKKEVDNMIARSISNIGGVYFRLEKYKDSIDMQKKALKIFEKQGDRIRQFRTEELMVGSYISLWECDINLMTHVDFELCMNYMKSAKFYYEITNNKSLNGIMEKISKLKKLEVDGK